MKENLTMKHLGFADYFRVTTDYLLGRTVSVNPDLVEDIEEFGLWINDPR